MKECNIKELRAGAITGCYIITDDFFIALSKYHPITNRDLARIKKYGLIPLYCTGENTLDTQKPQPAEKGPGIMASPESTEGTGRRISGEGGTLSGVSDGKSTAKNREAGETTLKTHEEATEEKAGQKTKIIVEKEVYNSAVSLTEDLFSQIQKNESFTIKQIYRISLLIINYISNLQNDALTYVGKGYGENRLASHSVNTTILTAITAVNLKLRGKELINSVSGALMHDTGILFLKEDAKQAEIRNHTINGYGYLRKKIQNPFLIKPALEHHEKAKGNGYPHRITLEKIGFSSRIVAICDSYDNQLSFIKYGSDISIHYTRDEFLNWSREDYDIRVLSVFIDSVKEFAKRGSMVSLNDGSRARVVKTMIRFPLNPIVQLEPGSKQVDLRRTRNLWIDKKVH